MERPVHPLPPLRKARLRWHEATIEGVVAAHAADYLRHLDLPQAQPTPVVRQAPLTDLVECQQPTAFAPQTGHHAPDEGPTPGAAEVCLCLYLNAHETDHRSAIPSRRRDVPGTSPQEYWGSR